MRATGYLVAAMTAAFALVATPALAEQSSDQQPPAGGASGPAAQPTSGPTLTLSTDGSSTVGSGENASPDAPSPRRLTLKPSSSGGDEHKPVIWQGTTFFFDQSVSSETAGLGKDYQSYNPSYQLWMSFRPRVNLYEDDVQKLNINGRIDYYKELTNSDGSTKYRQDEFSDVWLNLSYGRTLSRKNGWMTNLSLGPRVLLPVSLDSRAAGVLMTLGGGGALTQIFPLNRSSDWFKSGRVVGSVFYTHPFTKSTTADNGDINRPRQTLDGRTMQSNQLSGGFLTEHQLLSVLDTGLQITPNLGITFDLILIQQWRYSPKTSGDNCISMQITTGETCVKPGSEDAQRYRVSPWVLASIDYQLTDELNLAVGYYNVANSIGTNGQRRNMLYAPDGSRLFLTATIGLDALYERFRGGDSGETTQRTLRTSKAQTAPPFLGTF